MSDWDSVKCDEEQNGEPHASAEVLCTIPPLVLAESGLVLV